MKANGSDHGTKALFASTSKSFLSRKEHKMECLNRSNTYTLCQAVYKKTTLIPADLSFSYIVLNPKLNKTKIEVS